MHRTLLNVTIMYVLLVRKTESTFIFILILFLLRFDQVISYYFKLYNRMSTQGYNNGDSYLLILTYFEIL